MDLSVYSFFTSFLNKKANKVVGQIIPVIGVDDYIPEGTLPCNGSTYSRSSYLLLWNNYLIGTKPKYYAWVCESPSYTYWTTTETPVANQTLPLEGIAKFHNGLKAITNVGSATQITVTYTPQGGGETVTYVCTRRNALDERNHVLPTCSEAVYQEFMTNYGQCPAWTVNTSAGTFRTPYIKDGAMIQQARVGGNLCRAYNAGLPDIVARMANESGAINNSIGSGSGNWENVWWKASAWNPIYGASDTVQPVAISARYFVVI